MQPDDLRRVTPFAPPRALLLLVKLTLAAMLLGLGAGCSAISALTNPSAAWALKESTPMSVVVRRAEVANTTAEAVKRLLGETGIDEKSARRLVVRGFLNEIVQQIRDEELEARLTDIIEKELAVTNN